MTLKEFAVKYGLEYPMCLTASYSLRDWSSRPYSKNLEYDEDKLLAAVQKELEGKIRYHQKHLGALTEMIENVRMKK